MTRPAAGASLREPRASTGGQRGRAPPQEPGQGGSVRARGPEEELARMTRSSRWSSIAVLAATVAIVFAACGGSTASTAPSASAAAPSASAAASAAASAPAFAALQYPETGEAPCGDRAVRRRVQEDQRPGRTNGRLRPVRPRRRLPVQDRVHVVRDQRHGLARDPYRPGGHGQPEDPVRGQRNGRLQAQGVEPRPGRDLRGERRLLGHEGADPDGDPPLEQRSGPAARRAPGRHRRRHRQRRPDRLRDRRGRLQPRSSSRATGLNIFYLGFNNTFKPWDNEKVRQAIAMGIDRKRIVDNFYPAGSEVADYFTPCAIPNGCVGAEVVRLRCRRGQGRADRGRLRSSARPTSCTSARRSAATSRIRPSSRPEIQAQLKDNLNINVELDQQ